MNKQVLLLVVAIFSFTYLNSQGFEFLPKSNYWKTLTMDPLGSQSYGSISAVWEDNKLQDYTLFSFAFGFQKSFFAWSMSEEKGIDIGIEASAFAHYQWAYVDDVFERIIITSDYLIGIPVVFHFKPWMIRLRFWHISSHLGDDYILNNGLESYVINNMRYEQVDVTATYDLEKFRFYLGTGVVIRAYRYRAPMVFFGGAEYVTPVNKKGNIRFYGGFYADAKQELNYNPAINVGAGFQFGSPGRQPVKILLTYFYGPLPFSIFEGLNIQWAGIGIYFNPF